VGGYGGWLVETRALGNGYAATFLLSFALTALGLCMLLFVREPEAPVVRAKAAVGQRVRELPALLRSDRALTFYFVARALGVAGRMAVPFYYVYARTKLDLSGAELGQLTAAFLLAHSAFALLWGLVADRRGFRTTFQLALVVWILSALLLLRTSGFATLLVVFAALGAGMGGFMMASQNLVLEFGARENLPMRIAVANTTSEAVGVAGPIAAGLLADAFSYVPVLALAIACKAAALATMFFFVDEPRRRGAGAPP
jgi:MFS family permease